MKHPFITVATVAAITAAAAACTPPPPHDEAPPISAVVATAKLIRIDNTETGIAWCNSNPGGAPEWHTEIIDGQTTTFLACRIVS